MLTLPENIFWSWSKLKKKQPIWAKIGQKWLFITFAILAVIISNRNDCKLHKVPRNFLGHLFKMPMFFWIFEFEMCALMRLFLTRREVKFYETCLDQILWFSVVFEYYAIRCTGKPFCRRFGRLNFQFSPRYCEDPFTSFRFISHCYHAEWMQRMTWLTLSISSFGMIIKTP